MVETLFSRSISKACKLKCSIYIFIINEFIVFIKTNERSSSNEYSSKIDSILYHAFWCTRANQLLMPIELFLIRSKLAKFHGVLDKVPIHWNSKDLALIKVSNSTCSKNCNKITGNTSHLNFETLANAIEPICFEFIQFELWSQQKWKVIMRS